MSRRCCLIVLALGVLVSGSYFGLDYVINRPSVASRQANLPAVAAPQAESQPSAAAQARVAAAYGRLPLYFIANRGQVDERVRYYVQGRGHTTYFTQDEIVLALLKPEKAPSKPVHSQAQPQSVDRKPQTGNRKPSIVRIQPVGLQQGVKIAALEETGHRVNYFLGNDPKKWRTDIPTYRAVVYENAYAGIDLKFYGQGRELEYDVVVKPGADPGQVRFAYQGVEKMELTPAGDLALILPDGGRLVQKKPVVYQEVAGRRLPVEGKFRLCRGTAALACGFAVAAYDPRLPLVIDPMLSYSTYLGASDRDSGAGIAVDAGGAAYVTGWTDSIYFPTHQAYQEHKAGNPGYYDAFVTKLSAGGNSLVYSTFLGGNDHDQGAGIAVDTAGAAYVTGNTWSVNFPAFQAFQETSGGECDAFIAKLSPTGGLTYSSYLGGAHQEVGESIAVDPTGAAYVTGWTGSDNFPTYQAFQPIYAGDGDAFVTKVSANQAGVSYKVYSTYLGGRDADLGHGIAVGPGNTAYVTGETRSDDFPAQPPGSLRPGGVDAFVTMFNSAGGLAFSVFLGGSSIDYGYAIAVDAAGAAYVTGETWSNDFPVVQAFQPLYHYASDAFVTKLNPTGSTLAYSTYLGGKSEEYGYGIAVDAQGAAYVTGCTNSTNFPTYQAYQGSKAGEPGYFDAFVTKLSPTGNTLGYSTYLGGNLDDAGRGIAVDAKDDAYVIGSTYSSNFPTYRAFEGWCGNGDAFITKFGGPAFILPEPLLLLGN